MTAGLFVWAGGRWRALDTAGRVAGWRRRPRFVYRARGRLQLASSAAVLRGLRALLAGKASSVRDGAPLSQRRRARARCSACAHRRHCCSLSHEDGCTNNNKVPSIKAIIKEPAPTTTETGIQVTLSSQGSAAAGKERPPRPSPRPLRKRKRSTSSEPQTITKKIYADVHRHSSDDDPKTEGKADPSQKDTQKDSQVHFKELVINEEDVDAYRSYLIANDPTFDLYRFDSDEEYKLLVFFRINPLVNIERCVRIERMLRASQSSQEMSLKDFATKLGLRSVSDHDSDVRRRYKMRRRMEKVAEVTSDETDKENQVGSERKDVYTSKYFDAKKKPVLEERKDKEKDNHVVTRTRSNIYSSLLKARGKLTPVDSRSLESSDQVSNNGDGGREKEVVEPKEAKKTVSDSGSDFVTEQCPKKKTQPVKKFPIQFALPPSQKRVRSLVPYSSLEDHAIVAWVSSGSRARLVNGNRVWRELQAQYLSLTGQDRTWHSLRNRYLRHILPALGRLALPPPQAARLRAAAAAGELKSKKVPRRNSIFARPPQRSAFAAARARHKPRDEASDSDSQSPQRVLRSSGVQSPTKRDQQETSDNPEQSDQHNRRERQHHRDKRDKHDRQETSEKHEHKSDQGDTRSKRDKSAQRDKREQQQTSEDHEQSDRRDQQNTRDTRSKRDKSNQRDKRDQQEKSEDNEHKRDQSDTRGKRDKSNQRDKRDQQEKSENHEHKRDQSDTRGKRDKSNQRDKRDQQEKSENHEHKRDQSDTRGKRDKSNQRDKRDHKEKRDKRDQSNNHSQSDKSEKHETRDKVDQRDKRDHKDKRDSHDKRNHSDTHEKRDKRAQQEKRDQSNNHDQSDKRAHRDNHNRSDKRDQKEKRDRSAPARNRHGRFVRGHNYTSERLAKLSESRAKSNTNHAKLVESRGKNNDSRAKLNNAKSRHRLSKSLDRGSISSNKSDSDSKSKKETSQVRKDRAKQRKRRSKSLDQESISSVSSDSTDHSKSKARKTRAKLNESSAKLRESRAKLREKRAKSLDEESSSVSSESTDRGHSRRKGQVRKSRAKSQSDDEEWSDTSDDSEVSSVPPRDTRASLRDRSIKIRGSSEDSVPESRDKRTSLRDRSAKGRKLRDSSEEESDESEKPKRRDKLNKSNRSRDNAKDSHKSNKNSSLRDRVRQLRDVSKERDKREKRRASLSSDEDFQAKRVSRTPTYEQLTRQFASRLRSTPNDKSHATKSPATKSQRTRKLYNPNAPNALLR